MSLFIMRFKEQLEQSGKLQKDICKDLGISKQKLSKWKTGYNEPNLDDVIMIARYFGITVDYLIGNEEDDGAGAKIHNDFRYNSGVMNNEFKQR